MDLVTIVIPIYKETINSSEQLSLSQCLRILRNYPITFIAPVELDLSFYRDLCGHLIPFQFKYFPKEYFKDITGYNKLMLSAQFYGAFFNYKFMLIYQLDAYVFSDELQYWCNQNYDFIGAPHVAHYNRLGEIQFLKNYTRGLRLVNKISPFKHQISNVGNGGFSLRKIKKCYWLVKLLKKQISQWDTNNEDGFFKYWGNVLYPLFKLPPDDIALRFSIETQPKMSLRKLYGKLPFGCHAFEKYEWQIWKQFIQKNAKEH